MNVIFNLFASLLAALVFLYFFWKKLKDDYTQNQVFSAGFYCLFGFSLGLGLGRYYLPGFTFWTTFLFSVVSLVFAINKLKIKKIETFESWVLGNSAMLVVVSGYTLLFGLSLQHTADFVISIISLSVFLYFDKRYKRYVWYRSGKLGFSALATVGTFFLLKAASYLTVLNGRGLTDFWQIISSTFIAFISFLYLYNLSRKE